MYVSILLEPLLVILFFLLSTLFICCCVCKSESIAVAAKRLKSCVVASKYRSSRPPAPSTIYAFVPRASYKRNWVPTFEEEESNCTRHAIPIWLHAATKSTDLYNSTYSFKHRYSIDSELDLAGSEDTCYVSSV